MRQCSRWWWHHSVPVLALARKRTPRFMLPVVARTAASSALPASKDATPPLILALDLDETLLRPKISGDSGHRTRVLKTVDFEVKLPVGTGVNCQISLRPGVDKFFEWIRARREDGVLEGPWLFAQGHVRYVGPVLTKLDPEGDIFGERVLSKQDCTKAQIPGYVLKDLTRMVPEESIPQVILVDNNAVSAILHPDNALLVRDWRSDGKPDTELERVIATLDALIANGGAVAGNYAGLLAMSTKRHDAFSKELPGLMSLISTDLDEGESLQGRLTKTWMTACRMKQELLDLPKGEY